MNRVNRQAVQASKAQMGLRTSAAYSLAQMQAGTKWDKMSKAEQDALIAKAKRQYDAVKVLKDDKGRLITEDGKLSKLNEHQYRQVRTAMFKEWFGDWEGANKLNELDSKKAVQITAKTKTATEFENDYIKLPTTQTKDNRLVRFVNSIIGKIQGHKNHDQLFRIAPQFDELLRDAVPAYNEAERNPSKHTNIIGYANYVNKITMDGVEYYVRFTVQDMKAKGGAIGRSELHSAFVSDVEIYKAGQSQRLSAFDISGNTAKSSSPINYKLAQWFDSVKSVSKVVDPETGEPLVMYPSGGCPF